MAETNKSRITHVSAAAVRQAHSKGVGPVLLYTKEVGPKAVAL